MQEKCYTDPGMVCQSLPHDHPVDNRRLRSTSVTGPTRISVIRSWICVRFKQPVRSPAEQHTPIPCFPLQPIASLYTRRLQPFGGTLQRLRNKIPEPPQPSSLPPPFLFAPLNAAYRDEVKESEGGGGQMDPDALAKAFVEHYYRTFDTNRAGLGNLYQEGSMLTFEGSKIQGAQAIVAKLTGLPFQQCQHNISTVDCQPSGAGAGMLVFVSGSLQLAGEQHMLKFSQMFHLMPTPQGSYYVFNDIFRLNYA